MPTVDAVWQNLMMSAHYLKHVMAFEFLVGIGISINDDNTINSLVYPGMHAGAYIHTHECGITYESHRAVSPLDDVQRCKVQISGFTPLQIAVQRARH
jgi:hypothetical protein